MTFLRKQYGAEDFLRDYCNEHTTGLLAGCGDSPKPGRNWVRLDISDRHKPDIVVDLHHFRFPHHTAAPGLYSAYRYDRIICNAVLQYCDAPVVIDNLLHHLAVGKGYIYLEVPFVQQVCADAGGDRFRFTLDGLRGLVEGVGLEVVASGPTIRPGSALAWLAEEVISHTASNRWIRGGLALVTRVLAFPLHWLPSIAPERAAGGCYVIARRVA